jgi:hypothetical protein
MQARRLFTGRSVSRSIAGIVRHRAFSTRSIR